jgi:hypothetical protein
MNVSEIPLPIHFDQNRTEIAARMENQLLV